MTPHIELLRWRLMRWHTTPKGGCGYHAPNVGRARASANEAE